MAFTQRHVTPAGAGAADGTSKANAWSLATALASAAAGQCLNVYGDSGTYANTTTSRAFSVAGTTTAPVWWRGCYASPGDRDTDPTLTPPAITFTTGLCTFGGTHQILSHLNISGANTARQLLVNGNNLKIDRCRVENTNAASASTAASSSGTGCVFSRCWFKATSTATRVVQNTTATDFLGSTFTGGGAGIDSIAVVRLTGCVFRATGSHGFQAITNGVISGIVGCTFRGCGGDGIRLDVVPTSFIVVANCLFAGCTGTGINNATGTNTNVVHRFGNVFWGNGATEAGFGDSPSLAELTESSDPHTSATDLSLVTGALAKASGQPGLFENEAYTSYLDRGAVQRAEAGGAASVSGARIFGGM